MTEEERAVVLAAVSWVRWAEATEMAGPPKELVGAVKRMMERRREVYGGWEWCVDQVVMPMESGWKNHVVRGPGKAETAFFFKRVARCYTKEAAEMVRACLDGEGPRT